MATTHRRQRAASRLSPARERGEGGVVNSHCRPEQPLTPPSPRGRGRSQALRIRRNALSKTSAWPRAQRRTSPSPSTTYLSERQPSMPTGPRRVEFVGADADPAPRPYSKPSAKRVLALTMTLAESTSRKTAACRWSVVRMASVWWLP